MYFKSLRRRDEVEIIRSRLVEEKSMDMKQVICSEKMDKRGGLGILVNTPNKKEYRLLVCFLSL